MRSIISSVWRLPDRWKRCSSVKGRVPLLVSRESTLWAGMASTSHKPIVQFGCHVVNWVTADRVMGIIFLATGETGK